MKGLDLAKAFYHQYGEPMLREKFPELIPLAAWARHIRDKTL
jgi:hypothetical protein